LVPKGHTVKELDDLRRQFLQQNVKKSQNYKIFAIFNVRFVSDFCRFGGQIYFSNTPQGISFKMVYHNLL